MSFVESEISLLISSDEKQGALNKSADGSEFSLQLDGDGISLPRDAHNISVQVNQATIWWTVPNILTGINDHMYIFGDDNLGGAQLFVIQIPQGLYDVGGLNDAIHSQLESAGAKTTTATGLSLPLINLRGDSNTQKIIIRFNYPNVYVDFTQGNTPRDILGYDSQVLGPYVGAPLDVLADNVAAFNQVNYFLIHSDLVNEGIRFNNTYNQTISQVLIDVAPGSQIVSTPFNPVKSQARHLKGARRTNLRFWLTDDQQRPVNTAGEYWSAQIVIKYQRPIIIEHTK